MPKRLLLPILLFCAFCSAWASQTALRPALANQVHALPDTLAASFKSRHELVLDTASAPVNYYSASMSALNFSNAEDAAAYFNNITDNLLSYEFDFSTGIVIINIHLQFAKAGWTIADWNTYINKKLNP